MGKSPIRPRSQNSRFQKRVSLGIAVWCDCWSLSGGENRRLPILDMSGKFAEVLPGNGVTGVIGVEIDAVK
jgi:hypothetical protein